MSLADEIAAGKQLKKGAPPPPPKPDEPSGGDLLSQIRGGFKLKPVAQDHKVLETKKSDAGGGDMFSDLEKALEAMGDIRMTDSEASSSEDDEKWSD